MPLIHPETDRLALDPALLQEAGLWQSIFLLSSLWSAHEVSMLVSRSHDPRESKVELAGDKMHCFHILYILYSHHPRWGRRRLDIRRGLLLRILTLLWRRAPGVCFIYRGYLRAFLCKSYFSSSRTGCRGEQAALPWVAMLQHYAAQSWPGALACYPANDKLKGSCSAPGLQR